MVAAIVNKLFGKDELHLVHVIPYAFSAVGAGLLSGAFCEAFPFEYCRLF